jgi:hypothetical protein
VTIGTEWHFLYLDGEAKQVGLDREAHLITDLPRLLGILRHIIDASLPSLEEQAASS